MKCHDFKQERINSIVAAQYYKEQIIQLFWTKKELSKSTCKNVVDCLKFLHSPDDKTYMVPR
jgi:hypothetical protein